MGSDEVLSGRWFTVKAAASELRLSPETVLGAIREEKLVARKIGRQWFISVRAIEKYRTDHLGRKGWTKRKGQENETFSVLKGEAINGAAT